MGALPALPVALQACRSALLRSYTVHFHVAPELFDRFPGMRIVVAVAHGLDNTIEPPDLSAEWHRAWSDAARDAAPHGNAQSHPRVRPWRERFRAMGISGKEFPSSIEALLRRAMKSGPPFSINPLVDFYNTISLRHTVPAGGFDLDQFQEPLELRLTRDGDLFTSLELETPVPVPPGEVAYASGNVILTRHFVWRQSRQALIAPRTRSAVLLSEVLGELGPEVAEQVRDNFVTGLMQYFGVTSAAWIVGDPL